MSGLGGVMSLTTSHSLWNAFRLCSTPVSARSWQANDTLPPVTCVVFGAGAERVGSASAVSMGSPISP
jgi:hypothetical protein